MAYVPAHKTRLLIGDLAYSAYATQASHGWTQDMHDVTVLEDTARQYIAGMETSALSVSGLYDVTAFSDATGWKSSTAQPVTYAPSGVALGAEVQLVAALQSSFELSSAAAGVASFQLEAQTDGLTDIGVSLATLEAVTATANGTAHDGTASSANGGVGHVHVTAYSGITSIDVTVEHSANGSTGWAAVCTFTQLTAVGSERVVVAAGTTVNRYLRAAFTVAGTGSATVQVSFARR